ncbi:MAG TPA: glycosyltransferase, partial [Terriglobales bacterium]|nr:glycosyltransferase [Terriglobales bacterium]
MVSSVIQGVVLFVAATPFIYYGIALYSGWRFFSGRAASCKSGAEFTPPISILKPVKGLDPDAYENFASFCRQDYPEYEIVFCVGDRSDPVIAVIQQVAVDFPDARIRILFGTGRMATNDKVAKLARLSNEAKYDVLVISDSDVRADPGYLRTIVAPLEEETVGAVTCFYAPTDDTTVVQKLQTIGMYSDFYPGIVVAWKLDGVKFALGPTIATTKAHLAKIGGYEKIENRPADDLLVGRLIAEQGHEVKLLSYTVQTVADFDSFSDLFLKRLRWIVVMRHMRPWGHLGLIFTFGLPWTLLAMVLAPTPLVAGGFLAAYLGLRAAMTLQIASWGLKQPLPLRSLAFIPFWDAMAFVIWLVSFTRSTIRWRHRDYYIRDGELMPALETHADGTRSGTRVPGL